jgi:hypothetical protein
MSVEASDMGLAVDRWSAGDEFSRTLPSSAFR